MRKKCGIDVSWDVSRGSFWHSHESENSTLISNVGRSDLKKKTTNIFYFLKHFPAKASYVVAKGQTVVGNPYEKWIHYQMNYLH